MLSENMKKIIAYEQKRADEQAEKAAFWQSVVDTHPNDKCAAICLEWHQEQHAEAVRKIKQLSVER